MNTRPGELGKVEAQRIARETAAILREVSTDDNQKYREHVLIALTRMEVKVDTMKEAFDSHIADDKQQFTTVSQAINNNSNWINKGIGLTLALVSMFGAVMWIIDRIHQK